MILALQSDLDLNPVVLNLPHPAAHILNHLLHHGAPVIMSTPHGLMHNMTLPSPKALTSWPSNT